MFLKGIRYTGTRSAVEIRRKGAKVMARTIGSGNQDFEVIPFLRESLTFRAAGIEDRDLLTETRIQVLRAANRLGRRSGGVWNDMVMLLAIN